MQTVWALAPVHSSALFAMSLNKFTPAPVGSFPLQAYLVINFPVAIMSATEGFSGEVFDKISEMSPFAR